MTTAYDAAMDEIRCFGDVQARIVISDAAVGAALRLVLRGLPKAPRPNDANVVVTSSDDAFGWNVYVDDRLVRTVPAHTPAPRVAEDVLEAACLAFAERTDRVLLSGVVLSSAGSVLAILGDDLDAARVVSLHLHSRGWNAIAFRHAFVRCDALSTVGVATAAVTGSSSIKQIPLRYRSAVEASRWYDTGFELSFYAVDIAASGTTPGHDLPVRLTHVALVDGALEEEPILEVVSDTMIAHRLGRHALARHLNFCNLTVASPVASCNEIERWIDMTSAEHNQ